MYLHKDPPEHYLGYVVEGKIPVVIIPGILGKWGFMKNLGDKISLAGHPVYIVTRLGYNLDRIPKSARQVKLIVTHITPEKGHILPRIHPSAHAVKEILETHNLEEAVLVAYSKGGLIGKYLLAHLNHDHRVKGMVAIATPFSGSALAKLIPHRSFQELEEDSRIVRELEKDEAVNGQIISIYPEFDNHVWEGSYLKGAKENIQVPISGHHRVIFSRNVQRKVLLSIEKIQSE